ncbi:carboxy methyl transferase for protein phosphatase 2A, partial [Kappamyces sp. JEL0680]
MTPDRKELIMGTNDDALVSRVSCVNAKYLDDEFSPFLLKKSAVAKRAPIINRGTYARVHGIDQIIDRFLGQAAAPSQIVSLGAGSDTRYFTLKKKCR